MDGQNSFNALKVLTFIRPVFNFVGMYLMIAPFISNQWLIASFVVQSAADGACPLMVACFDPEAESGDFFIPKNIRVCVVGLFQAIV